MLASAVILLGNKDDCDNNGLTIIGPAPLFEKIPVRLKIGDGIVFGNQLGHLVPQQIRSYSRFSLIYFY